MRPMIASQRHTIVECAFCGDPQDIDEGAHLFRINNRYACLACAEQSEQANDRSDYCADDLRAGEPSRA